MEKQDIIKRHDVRDNAFKLLYENLLRDDTLEELYDIAQQIDEIDLNDSVKHFVEGTVSNSGKIDEIIQKYSPKRSVSRISRVSLAILRLAFYEILFDEGLPSDTCEYIKTPLNVCISEAVLLAEKYCYKEEVSFINGILGSYSKDTNE